MLLVFTEESVPTWEVRRKGRRGGGGGDLVVGGTADTFEAAKAAALFEATARSAERRNRLNDEDTKNAGQSAMRKPGFVAHERPPSRRLTLSPSHESSSRNGRAP